MSGLYFVEYMVVSLSLMGVKSGARRICVTVICRVIWQSEDVRVTQS